MHVGSGQQHSSLSRPLRSGVVIIKLMAWPLRVYSCAIAFRNVLPLDSCFTEAKWTKLFTLLVYSVIGPRSGGSVMLRLLWLTDFALFFSSSLHACACSVSAQVFWISLDLAWALEMDDLHAR